MNLLNFILTAEFIFGTSLMAQDHLQDQKINFKVKNNKLWFLTNTNKVQRRPYYL